MGKPWAFNRSWGKGFPWRSFHLRSAGHDVTLIQPPTEYRSQGLGGAVWRGPVPNPAEAAVDQDLGDASACGNDE